jgi:hypothetical protein
MRKRVLFFCVITLQIATGFSQGRGSRGGVKGVAVAFIDEGRVDGGTVDDFQFYLQPIQSILKRDFVGVDFKVLRRGELLRLPDGTGLNVEIAHSAVGIVLAAPGKKRLMLSGVQTDSDFACAAAAFFRRSSPACPRS